MSVGYRPTPATHVSVHAWCVNKHVADLPPRPTQKSWDLCESRGSSCWRLWSPDPRTPHANRCPWHSCGSEYCRFPSITRLFCIPLLVTLFYPVFVSPVNQLLYTCESNYDNLISIIAFLVYSFCISVLFVHIASYPIRNVSYNFRTPEIYGKIIISFITVFVSVFDLRWPWKADTLYCRKDASCGAHHKKI